MGYPMSWPRVVRRNQLDGNYDHRATAMKLSEDGRQYVPVDPEASARSLIAGDMRRLEADSRDEAHLARYAEIAGITPEQAKAVLDAFFAGRAL